METQKKVTLNDIREIEAEQQDTGNDAFPGSGGTKGANIWGHSTKATKGDHPSGDTKGSDVWGSMPKATKGDFPPIA